MKHISSDSGTGLDRYLGKNRLARAVSDLLNPLFLSPLVFFIISWILQLPASTTFLVTSAALIFYTIIPLILAFYLIRTKHIISLDLPVRETRSRLYIYSIISAFVLFLIFLFNLGSLNPLIVIISAIYFINPIISLIINFSWKISIHTGALASAGAILLGLTFFYPSLASLNSYIFSLTILFLLLPVMVWSRYRLSIHTLPELLGGIATGFGLTIIELFLFNNLW